MTKTILSMDIVIVHCIVSTHTVGTQMQSRHTSTKVLSTSRLFLSTCWLSWRQCFMRNWSRRLA